MQETQVPVLSAWPAGNGRGFLRGQPALQWELRECMSSGVLPGQKASLGSGFPRRVQSPGPYCNVCLGKLNRMGKAGSSLALPVLGCDLDSGSHNEAGEALHPGQMSFQRHRSELLAGQ